MHPTPTPLRSRRIDFSSLPSAQRRRQYIDFVGSSWQAEFTNDADHPIVSTMWDLGLMVVAESDFPARRILRTSAQVRRDQIDHLQLQVPLARVQLEANRTCEAISAGSAFLLDLGRPFEAHTAAGPMLQVFVPRDALEELLPRPGSMHALRPQGASSMILVEMLKALVTRLPSVTTEEAAHIAQAALHMIAASVAPTSDLLAAARPIIDSSLHRQACRYIDLHLRDPDLDAARIGRALGLSRSALYRLFEPYGGVAAHILERRLERSYTAIATRSPRLAIADIAQAHGFKSATTFSRAFRARFGHPPSDASTSGIAALPMRPMDFDGDSLTSWLRPLRG